ncbi:MAG: minor tail protein [Bacteriophage sp.]|nr:MAG: minor tail protein [Bacteriophage sp.]
MAADGKVVIEVELKSDQVEGQLNELKNAFADLGGVGKVFGEMSSLVGTFSNTFKALSGIVGPVAAGVVAAVTTMVTAFSKLYDASKQNFFENLQNISEKLQPVVDIVQNATNTILDCFSQVTDFNFDFSTLMADAIEFESSMARVSGIMGVLGDDAKVLTETTRQYGATTRYTSVQVSEAFSYMGMAGFSLQESLASIQDVLNLTTIGATELGTASDIVTDGLTAMNMSASQASNFVDYMAATITRSNTTVELMGETMKYAGSVAGTLGVSMDDLSVAIGLMANSSVKGSRAGTAMRTLLANLSAPTETVAKAMDKYGIGLVTAKDGSVDLDKTLRNLRSSLKSLPLVEQAAACKDLAGKTGMTGLLSIVNATDDAYDSLTDSVQNSTQTVSYWNQNLGEAGVTGKECSKRINNLKEVLSQTEYLGAAFNMTTQDMALALQVLGSDAKVTTKNVEDLFGVLDAMRDPTQSQKKIFKELGLSYREIKDDAFDYSATCDMINENTKGIVDSSKGLKNVVSKNDLIKQLYPNMSLEKANEVLKKYGMTAKTQSTGQIDLIANLKELRSAFSGMDQATREQTLSNLGLSNSLSEINEVCGLSDEQFDKYCKNLELVTGLSEKMSQTMDETTKYYLLVLSSALQDVAIQGFEFLKPSIQSAADALAKFFTVWRSGNEKGNTKDGQALYTFDNFKKALDNLLGYIRNADISGAIQQAFSGINTFITKGGLSRVLAIGKEIIHQICQGIIKSKGDIREGISSAIKQISEFVKDVAPEIEEAGKVILDALRDGIKNNSDNIHDALEAVASVMNTWIEGSEEIKSLTGNFADIFIDSLIENFKSRTVGRATELWNAATSWLTHSTPDFSKGGTGLLKKISEWFTGESYADEKTGDEKPFNTIKDSNSNKINNKLSSMDTNEIKALQTQLTALQTTAQSVSNSISQAFTSLQNNLRTSLVGCANIARNQFVSISNVARNQCLNVSNIVRNQFLSISNIIRNQITNARNVVTSQMISMKNVISTQISEARNKLTSQMISIRNVSRTQITLARNAVTSQMISMKRVITTQSREARNNFTRQMISMKNVARTQSREIGQQMANGVTQGIQSGTSRAVSAARSLVNQVNAEMKKTAKINSPSKVTTDYGEYMDEGLIVGMKNKAEQVYAVARNVTSEMQNAMKMAVQSETTKFSLEASSNSNLKIVNSVSNNTVKEIANSLGETLKETIEGINDRPIQVEANIDKTKVVDIIAQPVQQKNKKIEKRKNRLGGITSV